MIPYQMSFKKLRDLALSCSNKKEGFGRMLTRSFRLWYNKEKDNITLYDRVDQSIIAITENTGIATLRILSKNPEYKIKKMIRGMYGIKLSINRDINLKNKYPLTVENNGIIIDSKGNKHRKFPGKLIYIPGYTYIHPDGHVTAIDYEQPIINAEWNKRYTKISKDNRAAITAMNNMLPYDTTVKNSECLLQPYTDIQEREWIAVNLVMSINEHNKPNGDHIEKLRMLLNMTSSRSNRVLRKNLQKMFNDQRYRRAEKDGQITFITKSNFPR